MGSLRRYLTTFLLLLGVAPFTGCLFRTRRVEQDISTTALKTATKADLVLYINSQAAKIQTMQAKVDIDTSVGGAKKGKVTEYREISGHVYARQPAMLRMIGLLPFIGTAFDLVSDGQEFKLFIPPKNRFYVGRNDVATPNPQQPLEGIRPQIIYDALLLRAIDPEQHEYAEKYDATETVNGDKGRKLQQPDYVINVGRTENDNNHLLARQIIFNRVNLLPDRQLIYDQNGHLMTDVRYSDYKDYVDVLFPSVIEIRRPEEEYNIRLHIAELQINLPLDSKKFVLEKPPGAQEIRLDRQ